MTWQQWQAIVAAACVSMLSACSGISTHTTPLPPSTSEVHRQQLQTIANISEFGIQGRIGVQANGKGFSGSTSWRHTPEIDSIAIYSPLGSQVATIDRDDTGVTMIADGKTYKDDDIESLTQKHLGWNLPMSGLPDWILGRPSKRSSIETSQWDSTGKLTTLSQDGWDIEFTQYVASSGYQLPQKLTLRSKGLNIKLIVERWIVPERTQ